MLRYGCCSILILVFVSPTFCEILKDHASDSALFDGVPIIAHSYPPASPQGAAGVSTVFVGDGQILKTVGAIFAHEDPAGTPNAGSPGFLDFRLAFHQSIGSYIADPFLEAPASPNVFHLFSNVSNPTDWLVPLAQSDEGHDYFYWEFDVEFLGIATTPGQHHLLSIIPETNFQSGPTFMAFSRGGPTSVGSELDWFTSRPGGIAPATLQSLGAPHDFAAYRIATVPEPSSWLVLLALIGFFNSRK